MTSKNTGGTLLFGCGWLFKHDSRPHKDGIYFRWPVYERNNFLGGLSEIYFPFGTIISPPNTNERILRIGTNGKAYLNVWATYISKLFARLTSRRAHSKMLVSMALKLHWGIAILEYQKQFGSESITSKTFGTRSQNVLEVKKYVCANLFPKDQWVIPRKTYADYCNYMLDVLLVSITLLLEL